MNSVIAQILKLARLYWHFLTLILLAVVTIASLSPPNSAGDPGAADKTMHILAYAACIFPAAISLGRRSLLLALGIVIYSGVIELVQPLVGRSSHIGDLFANAVGVSVGLAIGYLVNIVTNVGRNSNRPGDRE